ncbi:type II secretion system protein N [Phenylobacterium sp.]|uniref:type II secretion system protein N n=1 Tax=Phenylobacterium sp. TaxID=1871053 RepID=UPI0027317AEC|nr:type II secretion system protein N [Phenylobacterium sp.]MDP1618215.1 type II secretion system protein N [Phenylobacterium sp.]MDP1987032.1 type II secretion system protein N [Phenylobacterium sp.]
MRPASPNLPLAAPALAAVFGVAALLVLLAMAPLSLALGDRAAGAGLSAAQVSGTVWRGRLSDAAYRGLRLGDVRLGTSPLSLLAGRPRLGFKGEAATGAARLGRGGIELIDLDAALPLGQLAPAAGLSGTVRMADVSLDLRDGECRRADGQVCLADIGLAGLQLPGLALVGDPTCSGASLALPLRGQAEGVDVQADLLIGADGGYQMDLILRTTRPEVEAALGMAGYERTLNGYQRRLVGRLGQP